MYITFLIGNGFDINLGLKTRYSDFYDYYMNLADKDSIILSWMKEDKNKETWADLETTLGEKLNNIGEELLDNFMNSHDELDYLLLEYLESEENRYVIDHVEERVLKELSRSLKNIPKELTAEEQRSYESTCKAFANTAIQYWFINFNYTSTLDRIIERAKNSKIDVGAHSFSGSSLKHTLGDVHHVHGTLSEGVVLGVNDESQINNDTLAKNQILKDTFLKERINRQMGERRTEQAENIIDNSQIICIFGMSLGITDKRWWEKLVSWLMLDENRKLIIYARKDAELFKRKIPGRIIRAREEIRQLFWVRGKGKNNEAVFEKIKQRILIIFNSTIFSFPKVESL